MFKQFGIARTESKQLPKRTNQVSGDYFIRNYPSTFHPRFYCQSYFHLLSIVLVFILSQDVLLNDLVAVDWEYRLVKQTEKEWWWWLSSHNIEVNDYYSVTPCHSISVIQTKLFFSIRTERLFQWKRGEREISCILWLKSITQQMVLWFVRSLISCKVIRFHNSSFLIL